MFGKESHRMGSYSGGRQDQAHGPRALGDLLGELFVARGLSQIRAATELETAWEQVIGEVGAAQTRVAGLRNGVLMVTVAHPTLLQELAAYRKSELLDALKRTLPGVRLQDLRFRIGKIDTTPAESGSGPRSAIPDPVKSQRGQPPGTGSRGR
jgi:predicted nucleic acid-binding Zn ribbon protein